MRLYLIRHAESENNLIYGTDQELSGHKSDPEITQRGHEQAKLLGEFFAKEGNEVRQHPYEADSGNNFGLTHIYCSLMVRTMQTGILSCLGTNLRTLVIDLCFASSCLTFFSSIAWSLSHFSLATGREEGKA